MYMYMCSYNYGNFVAYQETHCAHTCTYMYMYVVPASEASPAGTKTQHVVPS